MDFINDGAWHPFTVQASEAVVVVANPTGSTPTVQATATSGEANRCPAESQDSLTGEDGQTIYLAGCSAGPAKVELRRASDKTLLRTYTFTIDELPTATTGPTIAKIYWTNGDKIQRADSDGSNVEDLVTFGSPRSLALDVLEGKIYWSDQDTRWIWRANLDGSETKAVVTSRLIRPVAIALDLTRGQIYWTDAGSNKIQRANLDGSRVETLVSIGLHSPEGLALDVDAGKVYWSDYGTNKIQRANLDGSHVEDLVTTGLKIPGELALDLGAGRIYWTDYGTDKIQRADLDGSNVEDVVTTGLRIAKGLALDVAGGKIYWTDSGTDKIQRADLDGSNVETLVNRPSDSPTGLALANPVASLSPNLVSVALPRDGTWRRFEVRATEPIIVVANPSGTPARILIAQSRGAASECPAQPEDTVTRYGGQDLYLAACETGEAKVEIRRASDQAVLRAYTLRIPEKARMYWTHAGTRDKIQRANLDGSKVEDIVTAGLSYPVGLALDLMGGKMYWTDMERDRIRRANLDGSNVEDLVTTGLSTPRGLALDVAKGKMYWADQGTDKIHRADLDGSNIQDLVAGLRNPDRLALDLEDNKIYWTHAGAGEIQRSDLDGSNVEDLITNLGEPRGLALDLDGGRMYWTDNATGRIRSATSTVQEFRTLSPDWTFPPPLSLSNLCLLPPLVGTAPREQRKTLRLTALPWPVSTCKQSGLPWRTPLPYSRN